MPAPPHSSAIAIPYNPIAARPFRASFGNVPSRSQAAAFGKSCSRAYWRTASRSIWCSWDRIIALPSRDRSSECSSPGARTSARPLVFLHVPGVHGGHCVLDEFDCHGGGFAAADAQAGDAALAASFAQGADQRHQDARAGSADGMAQGAGAAVDVDLLVLQTVLLHRRHGHDGEGFVDFVQVHRARAPAGLVVELLDRAAPI